MYRHICEVRSIIQFVYYYERHKCRFIASNGNFFYGFLPLFCKTDAKVRKNCQTTKRFDA